MGKSLFYEYYISTPIPPCSFFESHLPGAGSIAPASDARGGLVLDSAAAAGEGKEMAAANNGNDV